GAGVGVVVGGLIFGLPGAIVGGIVGGIVGFIGAELTGALWNCGDAGLNFVIDGNTFQYSKTTDLKIRGRPKKLASINNNIFARANQDDAIELETNDNVTITSSNQFNNDTFGRYGVCDIDGDGVDDLVLMTGVTWWFSSGGQFPWSFLKADPAILNDVQLGD